MNKKKNMMGLFGGTFDPIHNGHIIPVESAARALGLESVTLIPCYIPPHKAEPNVSARDRLTMARLAIQNNNLFTLSDIELTREKPSYSHDTLTTIKQQASDTTLCFFIGTDSLLSFNKWFKWQSILELCHLVVCRRPSDHQTHTELAPELLAKITRDPCELDGKEAGCVLLLDTPEVPISSTELRRKLSAREDVSIFMPSSVIKYIEDNGLYQ